MLPQLGCCRCVNQQAGVGRTHLQQNFEFKVTERASGDGSIEVGDGIAPSDHVQSYGGAISKQFFELLVRCQGAFTGTEGEIFDRTKSTEAAAIRGGSALWWDRLPCRWQVGLSIRCGTKPPHHRLHATI